ncbi:hypothetical protein [Streptomyces sp. NRRL F-4474]|uniref:hypothetical protein n=1 Tax=Streptomyces sp. NRRL F-4474 TaxID=1463851 RepID=UPI0004CC070B|nr:hypothetical protein [Streptomyces sp. NRRL F-4474]
MAAFRMELGEDREEPLAIADVAGVWQGSDGGRLTVQADGIADLDRTTRPRPGCGQSAEAPARSYTGPATWVFDIYPDEDPGIRFDYQGSATAKTCRVYLVIFPGKNGASGFIPQDPPGVRYTLSAGQQGDALSRTDPAGR